MHRQALCLREGSVWDLDSKGCEIVLSGRGERELIAIGGVDRVGDDFLEIFDLGVNGQFLARGFKDQTGPSFVGSG